MSLALAFAPAAPAEVAPRLDTGSVHLWRLAHARSEQRAPFKRLLAAYLGVPEAAVELMETARGKPALAPRLVQRGDAPSLEFNWSHSGEYAMVALARGVAPGVDIEHRHARANALSLARRFFAPDETAALAQCDADECDRAFIELWCAKEAVLKATGEGIAFGLARLAFAHADAGWRLARLDPALGNVPEWQLAAFEAAPGYHGALAWRGGPREIVALRLPQD